jgi:hypothetical protein
VFFEALCQFLVGLSDSAGGRTRRSSNRAFTVPPLPPERPRRQVQRFTLSHDQRARSSALLRLRRPRAPRLRPAFHWCGARSVVRRTRQSVRHPAFHVLAAGPYSQVPRQGGKEARWLLWDLTGSPAYGRAFLVLNPTLWANCPQSWAGGHSERRSRLAKDAEILFKGPGPPHACDRFGGERLMDARRGTRATAYEHNANVARTDLHHGTAGS